MNNLRSSKRSMTEGTEWKAILAFAIPIILGNMLQQLYNTVDGIIVGRYVNSDALAAVGTCSTLSRFFLCFSMGFSNGCGVIISQFYGAKREENVRQVFTTGALIALGIGAVLTALGLVFHNWILASLMNVKDERVFYYADQYFVICCLGLVFTYAYNYIAYSLRAFGDSRATLCFLALTSIINLALDIVLVKAFGIAGAAVATLIAQIVCAAVSYLYMTRRHQTLNIPLRDYRLDRAMSRKCVSLGIPAILQQCSVSLGNIAMQRLVNSFGSVMMAAYTVGSKVEGYLHAPISGIQQSVATFSGQNIGAGRLDRVKRGMYRAVLINTVVCVAMGILSFFTVERVAAIFGLEGESLDRAVRMIRFYSYTSPTLLFFGAYFGCSGVIHGSGDVGFATLISLSALASRVLISYVGVYAFDASYEILWQTCLVSNGISMVLAWSRYFNGKWKAKSEKIIGKRSANADISEQKDEEVGE